MNIFIAIKECWDEDPKLFIGTIVGGMVLALLVPVGIALMLVM